MREEAELWMQDAFDSLKVADKNFKLGLYHVTAFYCQQAVEKILKAAVFHLAKRNPPKTHNLYNIYFRVKGKVPLSKDLVEFIRTVTPYYSIARYPNAALALPKDVITKKIAEECLNKTREVLSRFEEKLS